MFKPKREEQGMLSRFESVPPQWAAMVQRYVARGHTQPQNLNTL